ncbi:FAD-dependent monooxygenase [Bradyrhizobium sp. LHD-71]|uniref:FAD-dependent monooxygenase n=1 Tax=Bradyrhizobium sp. LHD-71 TaxID=3072141 RepID=UPI00280F0036|nr:FAD-dependent monooxygenase [Bradyrhizobium sp. LHD-71]MDQ8728673.1 FAD-dependent monooxygenase [Bradyrhizobium sp. LHD-71]
MSERTAVIVGAGVAGLSSAFWLKEIGWTPIVVERAASVRSNGYMMSLSGPGHAAAKRMGILDRLEAIRRPAAETIYRDRHGSELLRLQHAHLIESFPYIVLRRTDLLKVLFERASQHAEFRFSTEVASINNGEHFARVTLTDGSIIDAALVIGADGFRSPTRRMLFGPDDRFVKPLGYRFAAYDVDDRVSLGANFLAYAAPARISEFYSLDEGRLAALHVWRSGNLQESLPAYAELEKVFSDEHDQVRAVMGLARQSGVLPILDDLAIVDMDRWSLKRVVLLGDAAHCFSLISGQGAGMAMTGACVLAEELARTTSQAEALTAYEARMRGPAQRLQTRSRNVARWFVPKTTIGFKLRNLILQNMPASMLRNYLRKSVQSDVLAAEGAL